MKVLLLLILLTSSFVSLAQQGPTVECFNCEGMMSAPVPVNGSWYNPEQPGTGYVVEFQNGRLLAYYFGYDSDGEQQWLITQGELERPEDDSDVIWKTSGVFESFKNGNAFNQPHQTPEYELLSDKVSFEFTSMHNARISVNDEPYQNFVPLIYGVGFNQEFEESPKRFPDLEGMWSFVYKRFSPETLVEQYLYFTDIYYIRKRPTFEDEGTKYVEYSITKYYPYEPFEALTLGDIQCSNPILQDSNNREVICKMIGFPFEPLGLESADGKMIVPIGDLGPFAFSAEYVNPGENESGFTIEASRINYLGLGEN